MLCVFAVRAMRGEVTCLSRYLEIYFPLLSVSLCLCSSLWIPGCTPVEKAMREHGGEDGCSHRRAILGEGYTLWTPNCFPSPLSLLSLTTSAANLIEFCLFLRQGLARPLLLSLPLCCGVVRSATEIPSLLLLLLPDYCPPLTSSCP